VEVRYVFDPNGKPELGGIDTRSSMSMIDSTLLAELPWIERTVAREPVTIGGLGDMVHKSWETVVMTSYIPDESGQKLAKITREFHVVNDLNCKLLIANDITAPE